MKYCKRCLQPDTRPDIRFNDEQVCYACIWEEEKRNTDWEAREKELREIAEWAKKTTKVAYDCAIGVSGGKDSTFQACYARDKLGLRPLLVNGYPDQIPEIGRHNLDNISGLGFDLISMRPNPQIERKLAKRAFYKYGNPIKPSEYHLVNAAYLIAIKFDIPLVIQGENASLTLGVGKTLKQGYDGNALYFNEIDTLQGGNMSEWVSDDISPRELYLYEFPDHGVMEAKGIRAVYLQYYAKEWSQVGNAEFSAARGIWGRTRDNLYDMGRYRRYTALDGELAIVNQMLKYLKFGFGFATDEVCYDIREGRLSREDAKWHVKEYDGLCGEQYIDILCKYIDISKEEFWRVADSFVNKRLFYRNEKATGMQKDRRRWLPKFDVGE